MATTESIRNNKGTVKAGSAGFVWFLGFIGALIYYLHVHSGSLLLVIVAILKALVWPVFLVYHLFVYLHV